jgi:hypothetical protein
MKQEVKVTLNSSANYFDDVLMELNSKLLFNFVTDTYISELPSVPLKIIDMSIKELIPALSEKYNRLFVDVGNGYVFLKSDWYLQNFKDTSNIETGNIAWKGTGEIRESPSQKKNSNDFPRLKYPRKVNIVAKRVPISKMIQEISRQTGWQIDIEAELRNRRVSAILKDVNVEKAIEMLTLVLDSRQTVRINKSLDQKKWESEKLNDALDNRPDRVKESDKLIPELLNILNDAQKMKFGQGKEVAISMKELPAGLKEKCKGYLMNTMKSLQMRSDIPFDMSRLDEFAIVLLPQPSQALGGDGFTLEGMRIHF